MEERHYKLTDETIMHNGHKLRRIMATRDNPIYDIKAGDLGGFIEGYSNLSGIAWVDDDARVYDGAVVTEFAYCAADADVSGAKTVVCDKARISNSAIVVDTHVSCFARITGDATVTNSVVRDSVVVGRGAVITASTIAGAANLFDVTIADSRQVISATLDGTYVTITPAYILAAGRRFNTGNNKFTVYMDSLAALAEEWTTEFREWVDRWFNILCVLQEKTRNINEVDNDICRHATEYVRS